MKNRLTGKIVNDLIISFHFCIYLFIFLFRLQETSFASPLDLRLGAEPFSYNRTSIGMFYPPPPPPPPIRPSDPTFDPTFDGFASRPGQSASLPQQSDEIRVMQPFFTNSSQPIENPTCFGISPIPKSPRNWDNEQMHSPLSTGGKTEQEESVIQPNVKIQASTPLRLESVPYIHFYLYFNPTFICITIEKKFRCPMRCRRSSNRTYSRHLPFSREW